MGLVYEFICALGLHRIFYICRSNFSILIPINAWGNMALDSSCPTLVGVVTMYSKMVLVNENWNR